MSKLVSVELWSDLEAAGGSRLLVLDPDRIFQARLSEDLKGKSAYALTVAAEEALRAGREPGVAAPALERTDLGFFFADEDLFDRAQTSFSTIGGGWSKRGSWRDSGARYVEHANFASTNDIWRDSPTLPEDCLFHWNFNHHVVGNPIGWIFLRWDAATPGDTLYDVKIDAATSSGEYVVEVWKSGVLTQSSSEFESIPDFQWHAGRFITEKDGANVKLRFFRAFNVGDAWGLGDLTQKTTEILDVTPISAGSPTHDYGVRAFRAEAFSLGFLAKRLLTVNSLPTGYKIRIDEKTGTLTTESAGTAVLNLEPWALPYELLEVLDASDEVMATVRPPPFGKFRAAGLGGGFGDTWDWLGLPATPAFTRGLERRVLRTALENGVILEHRII